MHRLLIWVSGVIRDPRTWDRVGSTVIETYVLMLAALNPQDSAVVAILAGLVNLGLCLLPEDESYPFSGKLLLSAARTWLSMFSGILLAATTTINASVLSAAMCGALTAAVAAVKGMIGNKAGIGEPGDPSWHDPGQTSPPVVKKRKKVAYATISAPIHQRVRVRHRKKQKRKVTHEWGPELSKEQAEMLRRHNEHRAEIGKKPLRWDTQAARAAKARAADLHSHNLFEHRASDGRSWDKVVKLFVKGWLRLGENLAEGYSTVFGTFEAWLRSLEHRRNVEGDYTHVGLARVGDVWCAEFVKR